MIEYLERLLHGRSDRTGNSLPVLLLEFLRDGELVPVRPVVRRLDPELELGRVGQQERVYLIDAVHSADVFEYIRVRFQRLLERRLELFDHVLQECPRSDHRVAVVSEEGWYPQCSCRKSRPVVDVVKIVFDIPVDVRVRHDVHTRIGEVGYLRQCYR